MPDSDCEAITYLGARLRGPFEVKGAMSLKKFEVVRYCRENIYMYVYVHGLKHILKAVCENVDCHFGKAAVQRMAGWLAAKISDCQPTVTVLCFTECYSNWPCFSLSPE